MEFLTFEIFYLPVYFWMLMVIVSGSLIWLVSDKIKRDKEFWEDNDLKNARSMTNYLGITSPFGIQPFVVSEHKWVIIQWDKSKNMLNVWEPQHTYKTPEKFKLGHGKRNWKIDREVPKVYTTVEQHFKRQVM